MLTVKSGIEWYSAKEVHPARNCDVVIITEFPHNHKLGTIFTVKYEDGHFNGKEYEVKDVICWTYKSEFEPMFKCFKEEDDF